MEERSIEEIAAEDRREMYRLNEVSHVTHNIHNKHDSKTKFSNALAPQSLKLTTNPNPNPPCRLVVVPAAAAPPSLSPHLHHPRRPRLTLGLNTRLYRVLFCRPPEALSSSPRDH
ncbi:hypothetical protein PIB30_020700 [Stylosanthes scabra]|uniref:Uncharacterized protein n=1 Tax=Stylosanthes scabra TaxID=79078 RepID=A0ABU6X864_9FABA|nr:hypothetical protein [Stylosanthes scabra]